MPRVGSLIATVALVLGAGCAGPARTEAPPATMPGTPVSDASASDPEAIALAEAVMERLGGRAAWDATRVLTWRFFGRRLHVWDKRTGDVRVEFDERGSGEHVVIVLDLDTGAGRAWRDGVEVTDPAALAEMLDAGRSAWINDSYWLVMPYKLLDPGVRLRHLGERTMEDGRVADVLELTFTDVGETPENKYHVYVARETGLVEQWDFYTKADDPEPRFRIPWLDWRPHGAILLSADRGNGNRHTDVAVLDAPPPGAFTRP